ncbi:YxlC family protein [Alkalihalobacillus sp. NPDC078783]
MKNDKNSQEPYESEEAKMAKQVNDGLEKVDKWHTVSTPNLQWFQQQVELEKKRVHKKRWKELIVFIFIAIFILSVGMAVVYREPIVFLYVQLIGLILLPIALYKPRRKVSHE